MSTNQVASWRQIFILPCDSFEDVTEWPDEAWIVNEFQTPQISLDLVAGKSAPHYLRIDTHEQNSKLSTVPRISKHMPVSIAL